MDQTTPIAEQLPATAQGENNQAGVKHSGLDLVQVSKPDNTHAFHSHQTMGQFLNHLDRSASLHATQTVAQIDDQQNFSIPINHSYLDNTLVLKALEAKDPKYTESTAADGTRTYSNISGLALTLKTFGKDQKVPIDGITIKDAGDGNKTYSLQIDNPMPPQTQKVFNTPGTIPLTFTLTSQGKVELPKDSDLLYSISDQSGVTLPGMALHDAMHDAGTVAQFIESNPVWVNDILAPFMSRFQKDLSADLNTGNMGIPAPADTTHRVIGKIVQASTATPAPPFRFGPTKITGPGDYHETMTIDGRERKFTVHVPPGYDPKKPTPMAIIAHGLSQTGDSIQDMLGANKVSDKEGFIAIYPDSVNWFDIKDLRTWDSGNGLVLPGQHAGDIHFMDSIIGTAKTQLNVDPMRVYMIGHSNGGMFTYATAAALSGELAGIGILSSAMSGNEPQPKEPLSMFNVHGTADSIIPFDGITNTPPVLRDVGVPVFQAAQYGTDYYKKLDGITDPYTESKSGKQTIITASNPANGTAVEQVTIAGADHVFNNSEEVLDQAWNFLKDHPRQTPPNPKDIVLKEPDTPVQDLTTVKQLLDDVHKRGNTGIEQDFDNIFDAVRTIKDGSISPANMFNRITNATHVLFNDPVNQFVQNTTTISKKQDHITIDRTVDATVPLDVGFGIGKLKNMQIGSMAFDLDKANGYPELKNISGITLHAQVAGHDLSSKIEDITELPDGQNGVNGRVYSATMQNPLPGWMQKVLMSPDHFNVDLKVDPSLTPVVVNAARTERQLLGKNPWVNGVADEIQDLANLGNHFNVGNTALVASDIGLTGAATYLAWRTALRFGGTRAKVAAAVTFLAAPMAIDFIRKEFEK